ncbi:MAG: hypothetical protein HYW49_02635, partial [Deltaproteobacteria bacterium]|nr:hypothetical protein [Deltaproteobacteria bacterium]
MELLESLRQILSAGDAGTQEELRRLLQARGLDVTQSTVSRALRKLGAVRAADESGRTRYRLATAEAVDALDGDASLKGMLLNIVSNGSLVVLQTAPGSASLLARVLDQKKPAGILGTIAGDDTI